MRPPLLLRRLLTTAAFALPALLLFAPAASAGFAGPESGGSPNADAISELYWYIMIIAAVIFFGVEGLLLYTLRKFRASAGHEAKQVRGNNRLEMSWTIGAFVILVVLGLLTLYRFSDIHDPPPSLAQGVSADAAPMTADGKLNVCVDGFQYGWRFIYQEKCTDTHRKNNSKHPPAGTKLYAFDELVVPAGVTVTLQISSLDVNHAWWVPELGGKFDATRGYLLGTFFRIPERFGNEPGGHYFYGQCAELCGRGHANMTLMVHAVSVDEFNAWAQKQQAGLGPATAAPAQNQ